MPQLVLERLLQLLPVGLGVSGLTFVLLNVLPGDPALAILGDRATPEAVRLLHERLGFDRPVWLRYTEWLGGILRGDLGTSVHTGVRVREMLVERLPISAEIVLLSQVIALALAIPTAVASARWKGSLFDRVATASSFVAVSVPHFLLAIILILIVSVRWKVLPASGYAPMADGLVANARTVALPAATLALATCAAYVRVLRNDVLETLRQPYVLTARAKGIGQSRLLIWHVLRNSVFSLVTLVGVNLGSLLGGAVIVETMFGIPGLGRLLVSSLFERDVVTVQGLVLLIACSYVFLNLLVDLSYAVLDPRIGRGRAVT